ncbi:MAG: ribose 5-phosphate isomerase B [Deltaproteobacteria bacterium]|nr:ribose 5-phosphate isomerase B [Deltaproteobacteria bacterium]MBW1929497.1 ribose 5-phosphate isomerase B [Deltaproteobacteria bacterium]MBW2023845.1 ribose 5-phosphate isomerase B [Deltaproteobacteria bacterium]MBW2126253.1 ribose 5-phosphate isomerase B [Deltaproteobacteria bacterium]RLB24210.1 MAG: ribose 5-phosphate isomerase B [Deltaproteobacteria bacterium]
MDIVIGCDHAGFDLKEQIRRFLMEDLGYKVEDRGVFSRDSVDYPQIAHDVASLVSKGRFPYGILICGTGIGMSIVANRYKGVRAALCHNIYTAQLSRMHNDANILAMGGRVIGVGLAQEMVAVFLSTSFEGGRHKRRIEQID